MIEIGKAAVVLEIERVGEARPERARTGAVIERLAERIIQQAGEALAEALFECRLE